MANHLDLEEQEQLDQLKHFWNTWGTLISVVLLVVAGSVAAWNGYRFWQEKQSSQAAALFDAIETAATVNDQARLEQGFADIRGKYAGTVQAGHAGLLVAKSATTAGNLALAKSALTWVADQAHDEGHKALARLRLSALLIEEKAYDNALAQLAAPFPSEYSAVVADRRGDLMVLQGKKAEAVAEYSKAYKDFPENVEYRRLVEIKLSALGEQPQVVAASASQEASK
jgi:predicted negative regulator of RcsB-dependent stress response